MKIRCDACDGDEASVYCAADEAALCAACDHRVHHANKLAVKHQRFSLHHPSPKQAPLCDICQERRAFLFCHQDRAILCRECDIAIHKANEQTQKHTRFLLTGVKLSATNCAETVSSRLQNVVVPTSAGIAPECCRKSNCESMIDCSISEYLLETLPGWHVEDFLDSSCLSHPHGYSKLCITTSQMIN